MNHWPVGELKLLEKGELELLEENKAMLQTSQVFNSQPCGSSSLRSLETVVEF